MKQGDEQSGKNRQAGQEPDERGSTHGRTSTKVRVAGANLLCGA